MSSQSRNLIRYATISANCVLSFTLGYFASGLRDSPTNELQTSQFAPASVSNSEQSGSRSTDNSEYESLLATIEGTIEPDDWLEPGGTNTIEPLPSNIVACTAEDIFGSREVYLKMFDDSTGEVAAENDPLGVTEDVLCAAFVFATPDDYVITFLAPFGHEEIWYGLSDADIELTLEWIDLDKSPPLSANMAIDAAKKALLRFEEQQLLKTLPDILEWKLEDLTLKPLGERKWYWLVTFEASPKPGFGLTGISPEISVLVTMDGRVLTPSTSEPTTVRRTKD